VRANVFHVVVQERQRYAQKLLITVWLLVQVVLLAGITVPTRRARPATAPLKNRRRAKAEQSEKPTPSNITRRRSRVAERRFEDAHQLRLPGQARVFTGEFPAGRHGGLLADAQKSSRRPLVREIRANLASAEYYAGWLMRLEGAATEEWMAETESARQHFRLLAEQAQQHGAKALATDYQKNLEAVIRLELMDLSELKGLPLPKQCQNCSNCSGKCRRQRESNCKNPGNKPGDVREKISEEKQKGAGRSGREGSRS
jgi:hypothetical protein